MSTTSEQAEAGTNPLITQQPIDNSGWFDRDGRLRGSLEPQPGRCGRRLKGTNPPRYCMLRRLKGRTACKLHGGNSPSGISSPNWRSGVHSQYLPQNLKQDYERVTNDAELQSLEAQLALLATRELELTKRLGEQVPWGRAVDDLVDLEACLRNEDRDKTLAALAVLTHTLREGNAQAQVYESTWHELREVLQEKARLALAESKRVALLGGFVRLKDLVGVLVSILQVIREHVSDPKARQAITNRVGHIMKSQDRNAARRLLPEREHPSD
jgi:hypothetical protein